MLASESTATASDLWFLNSHVRVALPGRSNAENISILEHALPFGDSPPLHVHEEEDELFYILEGELLFQLDGQRRVAKAGDALVAPRKQPHGFRVTSPEGARLLTITRGGFEAAVRGASRPAAQRELPTPVAPSSEMQAALASVCSANGIELVGPPMAS